ncbi:MAG TPA: flagellin [Caulobacteraceae bacterium]|jgi:flagellar hook-associated protein 3 FlgL|nr:flagellin [Caulobacteraceae bacterium]
MQRISTSDAYAAVIANMQAAQTQLNTASSQISSGETATDLQGYAAHAETLTAMQTVQNNVTSFISQDTLLANKLTAQSSGLQQIAGAATGASQAITSAIAGGQGDQMMQALETQFQNAAEGLNSTYNGEYLFAGGQVTTAPVNASSMSALASASPLSSIFQNDQQITSNQIDQDTTVQTGFLASNLGAPLMGAFQAIQAYANANGPFTGQLTTAQVTFLQTQVTALNAAASTLNGQAAQNGGMQSQLSNIQIDLGNQQNSLGSMIGGIAGANVAQATANLQQAQLAIQASAQVFLSLQNSSLLAVLQASGH